MALTKEDKKHDELTQALYKNAERTYVKIDNALKRSMLEDIREAHNEISNDVMKGVEAKNVFSPETMQLMHASHKAFAVLETLDGAIPPIKGY